MECKTRIRQLEDEVAGLRGTDSRLGRSRDISGILELSDLEEGAESTYGSKSGRAIAMSERHGVIQLKDSGHQDHVPLKELVQVQWVVEQER